MEFLLSQALNWKKNMFFVIPEMPSKILLWFKKNFLITLLRHTFFSSDGSTWPPTRCNGSTSPSSPSRWSGSTYTTTTSTWSATTTVSATTGLTSGWFLLYFVSSQKSANDDPINPRNYFLYQCVSSTYLDLTFTATGLT